MLQTKCIFPRVISDIFSLLILKSKLIYAFISISLLNFENLVIKLRC